MFLGVSAVRTRVICWDISFSFFLFLVLPKSCTGTSKCYLSAVRRNCSLHNFQKDVAKFAEMVISVWFDWSWTEIFGGSASCLQSLRSFVISQHRLEVRTGVAGFYAAQNICFAGRWIATFTGGLHLFAHVRSIILWLANKPNCFIRLLNYQLRVLRRRTLVKRFRSHW